jgi:hypothetical protein
MPFNFINSSKVNLGPVSGWFQLTKEFWSLGGECLPASPGSQGRKLQDQLVMPAMGRKWGGHGVHLLPLAKAFQTIPKLGFHKSSSALQKENNFYAAGSKVSRCLKIQLISILSTTTILICLDCK